MGARNVDEETIRRWISENSSPGSSSYLVYKAYLNQTGTGNPSVVQEFENTIGAIVWTRFSLGTYNGTLNGAFPFPKTYSPPFVAGGGVVGVPLYVDTPTSHWYTIIYDEAGDKITLTFYADNGDAAEWSDILNPTHQPLFIEIQVYP
jgi:hypothetical protein